MPRGSTMEKACRRLEFSIRNCWRTAQRTAGRAAATALIVASVSEFTRPAASAASAPANRALDQASAHWSFRFPQEVNPPAVKNKRWARTVIDQFILGKLEKLGLQPAPAADKRTLIR